MDKPLVSICCITYNHEPYIRDCLDGFVMQRTNFPFEVLIHDDASTDRTADIIREYEAKYPDIVKPIYQTENQFSKGVSLSMTLNYPRARGKYIAKCEGDDYWVDPLKLQKQFDFLESHPDYSMCGCRNWRRDDILKTVVKDADVQCPRKSCNGLNTQYLFDNPFATASHFFRTADLQRIKPLLIRDTKNILFGDLQHVFHLSQLGEVEVMPDRMVVYRIHANSAMQHGPGYRKNMLKIFAGHVLILNNNGCMDCLNDCVDIFYPRINTDKSLRGKLNDYIYTCFLKYGPPHRLYERLKKTPVAEQMKLLESACGK